MERTLFSGSLDARLDPLDHGGIARERIDAACFAALAPERRTRNCGATRYEPSKRERPVPRYAAFHQKNAATAVTRAGIGIALHIRIALQNELKASLARIVRRAAASITPNHLTTALDAQASAKVGRNFRVEAEAQQKVAFGIIGHFAVIVRFAGDRRDLIPTIRQSIQKRAVKVNDGNIGAGELWRNNSGVEQATAEVVTSAILPRRVAAGLVRNDAELTLESSSIGAVTYPNLARLLTAGPILVETQSANTMGSGQDTGPADTRPAADRAKLQVTDRLHIAVIFARRDDRDARLERSRLDRLTTTRKWSDAIECQCGQNFQRICRRTLCGRWRANTVDWVICQPPAVPMPRLSLDLHAVSSWLPESSEGKHRPLSRWGSEA